ncbi:TMF1 [Mytilus edulis]|uniref:TMF1 n=1 Tax=Mytilus edulis TaxID=6550 RepID=A0A8S3TRC9_MYTED|nr:TMF1 [Mytilus edulis]
MYPLLKMQKMYKADQHQNGITPRRTEKINKSMFFSRFSASIKTLYHFPYGNEQLTSRNCIYHAVSINLYINVNMAVVSVLKMVDDIVPLSKYIEEELKDKTYLWVKSTLQKVNVEQQRKKSMIVDKVEQKHSLRKEAFSWEANWKCKWALRSGGFGSFTKEFVLISSLRIRRSKQACG